VSSTYSVLCLSHDPAIVVHDAGYQQPGQAETAIREGIADHIDCDLMIGRYSYPLIEIGCPRTFDRPETLRGTVLRCCHGSTQWVDKDWLLLLTAAYQSDDPLVRQAVADGHHGCLPWERLRRLRVELGITVKEAAP
jgi:hypothetical protein